MAFVSAPLPHIEIFIVVIAVPVAFSEVLPPLSMVLIVRSLLLIGTVKDTLTVTDVTSLRKDLSFIVITVTVRVLRVHSDWHLLVMGRACTSVQEAR